MAIRRPPCRPANSGGEIPGLRSCIRKSIVGGMWINGQATAELSDSIMDATDLSGVAYVATIDPVRPSDPQPGGALTLTGCTVVGKVYSTLLTLVSDSIVWARLSAADVAAPRLCGARPVGRPQTGRMRPVQLPAGRIDHAAAVPVDRAGARASPTPVLLVALRRSCLREACAVDRRRDTAWSGRRRRDGSVSTSCSRPYAKPTCA